VDHPVHPAPARPPEKPRKGWSSEPYLREAKGPLAGFFHQMAGDPLLERMDIQPGQTAGDKPAQGLPPGLEKDWSAYFDKFLEHYHIDNAAERKRLEGVFDQRMAATKQWLLTGKKEVVKNAPRGNAAIRKNQTIGQRIEEYKGKLQHLRALEANYATLRHEWDGLAELQEARSDVNRLRGELQNALDEQTAEMKTALETALEDVQTKKAEPTDQEKPKSKSDAEKPNPKLAQYGPVPEPVARHLADWDQLDWIDFLTRWGLVAIGVCLLIGLLTRTACVAGAAFLLMLYLAMPPFPWLPPNPRAEGHYYFLDKNLIEMLALLTLATTASGRWIGLDGLLQFLRPRCWWSKKPAPQQEVVAISTPPRAQPENPIRVNVAPAKAKPKTIEILGMPPPEPKPPVTEKEPPHGH
jgi:uncharacterized membrane protein YphA (DoxX/SURF4 family)